MKQVRKWKHFYGYDLSYHCECGSILVTRVLVKRMKDVQFAKSN